MIKLVFPVEPQPAARTRSRRGGNHYNTDRYKVYLERLKREWMAAGSPRLTADMWPDRLKDQPLAVEVWFYRERKVSNYRKDGGLRLTARIYPTCSPDIDNCEKAVYDAMSGRLYRDDAQIVEAHLYKRYARLGESPRVELIARPITDLLSL